MFATCMHQYNGFWITSSYYVATTVMFVPITGYEKVKKLDNLIKRKNRDCENT